MFKDLEEVDSDDSESCSSEEGSKKNIGNLNKSLTAKVIKLKESLEKQEEFTAIDEKSTFEKPSNSRQRRALKRKLKSLESAKTNTSSANNLEQCKIASQVLAEEQVILKHKLEKSIHQGNVAEAERLSDLVSEKSLEHTAHKAVIAADYLKRKKEKEVEKAKRKRKKLAWGFETKKKWETKSNM